MEIGYRTKYYEQYGGGSSFYGGAGKHFGLCLLTLLLIVCTLGFGTPWVICIWHKWRMSNLIIDGHRIVFVGKGSKLFWRYLGLAFLSIISLGWLAVWAHIKIEDWLIERTHIEWEDNEPHPGAFCRKSVNDGGVFDHNRRVICQVLLVIFTLGIAMPWAICQEQRWHLNNMIIDGKQVVFEGTGKKLFWHYVGWFFLTLITLGIFGIWAPIRFRKWVADYTHFEE